MITLEQFKKKQSDKCRLIGLDLGSKRIGVSICDEKQLIATPLKTINRNSLEDLINELKSIEDLDNFNILDPQNVPTKKPCLYMFTLYRGVFDITAFLHQDVGFARKLSPFNSKITITSSKRSNPKLSVWNKGDLLRRSDFRDFILKEFNRGGYNLVSSWTTTIKSNKLGE